MPPDRDDQEYNKDTSWFVLFVSSVLGLAILMGIVIVRLNSEIDQARSARAVVLSGCRSQPLIMTSDPKANLHEHCKNSANQVVEQIDEKDELVVDDPQAPRTGRQEDQ